MKTLRTIVLLFPLLFLSCEQVVEVDLETARPRLVIDAFLATEKGTSGEMQQIKLSMSAGYYEPAVPAVSGATVLVTDPNGTVFQFLEMEGSGIYVCNNFVPVIGNEYTLAVTVNSEVYTATEIMKAAPEITGITQNDEGGFTGDWIEVRAFFTDEGSTDDFYLFRFKQEDYAIPEYEVVEDRFFQGNEIFALYSSEDLTSDNNLEITIFGISQRYYNYMNILTGIAGGNGGSPFQSPPATVRGNIVNTTNQENYPLGYFTVSEFDMVSYDVE